MKEKITRSFIDKLNKNTNIVEFMEDCYGSEFSFSNGSDWANTNCPLPNHEDSSPSFGVNLKDNNYNCFGCNAKGDLISLVQEVENLNFIEAIQKISVFAKLDVETSDLELKSLVNELSDSINTYLLRNENSDNFPGGMDEGNFLVLMAEKIKLFERKFNLNPDILSWTEDYYKMMDKLIIEKNYTKIRNEWKKFYKLSSEKAKELKLC